jgi:hypothetical protein
MSPLSPKPWSKTTAGPLPPTRTWIVAPGTAMSETWNAGGKGATAAAAGAATARLAARLKSDERNH